MSNKNESATVAKNQSFCQLNKAQTKPVRSLSPQLTIHRSTTVPLHPLTGWAPHLSRACACSCMAMAHGPWGACQKRPRTLSSSSVVCASTSNSKKQRIFHLEKGAPPLDFRRLMSDVSSDELYSHGPCPALLLAFCFTRPARGSIARPKIQEGERGPKPKRTSASRQVATPAGQARVVA